MLTGAPRAGRRADDFGILFVCTGNVCRSVMAEGIARQGLQVRLGSQAAPFRVASAGTAGLDGCPLHPYTARALSRLGAVGDGFASRRLSLADIDAADLILSAGREHRDEIVAMRPRASRRAYLLKEFARLVAAAAAAPPGPAASGPAGSAAGAVSRARRLVDEAARLRGRVPCADPDDDEITDPAATGEAFLGCAQVIDAALQDVLDALCGTRTARSAGPPPELTSRPDRHRVRLPTTGGPVWHLKRHLSIRPP